MRVSNKEAGKVANKEAGKWVEIYQTTPRWELQNMKRALSALGGFLNTAEDDMRLEAIKLVLKQKRGDRK